MEKSSLPAVVGRSGQSSAHGPGLRQTGPGGRPAPPRRTPGQQGGWVDEHLF